MPKVKIDNIHLYYELYGKGDPLLLIAGLGCDSQSWLPVVNELSNHFQIIVFDNRGVGRSNIPEAPYNICSMADDAMKLLDHLCIYSAHIVGHSMGGYIAQEFAINYPEQVNKLVLESTAPLSSSRNEFLFKNFFKFRQEGMDLEYWLLAWLFWLFVPNRFEDTEFVNQYIKNTLKYPYIQSTAGYKGQIEAISKFNTLDRLRKIQAKTLIIEGKEDILILPKESEMLIKGIPKSSMLYIEDTAHFIHLEKPKIFNKAVLKFLNT